MNTYLAGLWAKVRASLDRALAADPPAVGDHQQSEDHPRPYPSIDFPALEARHVDNARLYANREQLVAALGVRPGARIAELGVAFGDFSAYLISTLSPQHFVAIDTFLLHHQPTIWGRSSAEIFCGATHREYFEARFQSTLGCEVQVIEGDSSASLRSFPDHWFDLIYIDAGHRYEEVCRDAEVAKEKIRTDGVLVFNDYTMMDHVTTSPYGIVQAVNQLVVREDWQVCGFAFQHDMFCDIAIRRSRNQ